MSDGQDELFSKRDIRAQIRRLISQGKDFLVHKEAKRTNNKYKRNVGKTDDTIQGSISSGCF